MSLFERRSSQISARNPTHSRVWVFGIGSYLIGARGFWFNFKLGCRIQQRREVQNTQDPRHRDRRQRHVLTMAIT